VLNALLRKMAGEPEDIAFLTQDIHMLPYFHGNRSPRANPTLTGTLTGLKLSRTPEDMACIIWRPFRRLRWVPAILLKP
jgi:ribulose kinase